MAKAIFRERGDGLMIDPGVRSTAKGILLHEGKVLLNRCRDPFNGDYFCLPGGGQEKYETLAEAMRREMREETGYAVAVGRFAALFEEICDDPAYRAEAPQYCHKMYHIFVCSLADGERASPTEQDSTQVGSVWIPVEDLPGLKILPGEVAKVLPEIIAGKGPFFLGSKHHFLAHG